MSAHSGMSAPQARACSVLVCISAAVQRTFISAMQLAPSDAALLNIAQSNKQQRIPDG